MNQLRETRNGNIYQPQLPLGWFRELNSVHLHIDKSAEPDLTRDIVSGLERKGASAKVTHIASSIAGPQREEYSEMYHFHAPGGDYQNKLRSFFTIRLNNDNKLMETLGSILPLLSNTHCVVEVERVVGVVDERGGCCQIPYADLTLIDINSVGFKRFQTLPLEIHLAFSVPREGPLEDRLPISLEQLLEGCIAAGIPVGEWLLVEKSNRWSYRSNMFAQEEVSLDLVREQRVILSKYLKKYSFDYSIWAIVEQVLGVWKMPCQ